MNFSIFKIFENLKLFKILLSLNVKFCVVFVFLSHIVGFPSPGVRCYTTLSRLGVTIDEGLDGRIDLLDIHKS
jgi:hypothetical protein